MKIFKSYPIKLFLIFFLLINYSCSEESALDENNFVQQKNIEYPDLQVYLENKYPQGYSLGYERTFEEGTDTFLVTEVYASGETTVSAFVVLTNNNFSQFMEFDRAINQINIDDFNDQDYYSFNASDSELENIFNPGMLSIYVPPTTSSGRFWGWSCSSEWHYPNGECARTCAYYVLWRAMPLFDDEGNVSFSQVFPCNALPGRNPKLEN